MKSPITGKEMSIAKEQRNLSFRKEEFPVVYHFYVCEESGEQFTTDELDQINLQQAYNQYRDLHNIPFPDEIKEIREKYGLSAVKMSEILGFGVNSYRNYEAGEVPSHSNGKMIQLIKDPAKFRDLVKISDVLDQEQKLKLIHKINGMIHKQDDFEFFLSSFDIEKYLLDGDLPDALCGYRRPSLKKFANMIVYFSSVMDSLFTTKLNKLLFYADFLNYKRTCFSISGARYRAITMGPVPNNFHSIFEYLANKDEFDIIQHRFEFGVGEQFKAREDRPFNAELFDDIELQVLKEVADKFSSVSTNDMIEISHKEKAWIDNQINHDLINYKYGFELTQI